MHGVSQKLGLLMTITLNLLAVSENRATQKVLKTAKRLFCLIAFSAIVLGCGEEADEVNFIGPTWIENVCISKDRPAEALIHVSGLGGTGCGSNIPFKNIYVDRVENTISLRPTVISSNNGMGYTTCSAIEDYSGEVTIKDLDVGEYEIAYNDSARLRLRIEKGAAFVFLRLKITNITFEMKTSKVIKRFDVYPRPLRRVPDPLIETDELVQVTMGVKGYFDFGSHIEDASEITSIKREAEEITVDISGKVEMTNCMEDISVNGPWYDTEIDLGMFRAGDHRVNVNGGEVRFSIVR